MPKQEISSKNAPVAIGPYSQAIKVGNFIFCSGQIAINPKTGSLEGESIEEQTRQVFENLKQVLREAGGSLDSVVKTTVYLANMNDFPTMNEIYAKYFKKPYPARATVEVVKLPKNALIEIDCIAYISKSTATNK